MITTSELIDWLRAEDEDADLIEDLRAAAIAHVENETGMAFSASGTITQSITWNGWPMALLGEPSGAVTLEQWDGSAWEAVAADRFYADGAFLRPAGSWTFDTPWPRFRATYTAGYVEGLQPAPIQLAVRMLVSHWYENRESVVVGEGAANEVPMTVRALIAPYKRVAI